MFYINFDTVEFIYCISKDLIFTKDTLEYRIVVFMTINS